MMLRTIFWGWSDQAGEPGEREQRIVTLTAELVAENSDKCALEREAGKQKVKLETALKEASETSFVVENLQRQLQDRDAQVAASQSQYLLLSQESSSLQVCGGDLRMSIQP